MIKNKIFILLPDGIGLRNFAYSNFVKVGKHMGYDSVFWNNTPFQLSEFGFQEIKIQNAKAHFLTDIYKNARKHIELNLSLKKTKDQIYNAYRFPFLFNNLKSFTKSTLSKLIIATHSSDKGLFSVCDTIKKLERRTPYYKQCFEILKREQPEMVFCTNQRPLLAISPLLAAQDLGIPTVSFIFSWDNLPKATMVVETDFYFVWSKHMKEELMNYYPSIQESQIKVTGTPQFESHLDNGWSSSKESFYLDHGLYLDTKYICYSGDDITTCPDDPQYLEDVAIAVRKLNNEGNQLGIIFRRCPVDFSSRYYEVLEKYKDVIVVINPKWEKRGEVWNCILPTQDDIPLHLNTIQSSEMVINLGSSMVFDYAAYSKPCAYINYDVKNPKLKGWTVERIYKFIHFRSMPKKEAVIWLNTPEEIELKIKEVINENNFCLADTQKWFRKIVQHPIENASDRIWKEIKRVLET